MEWKRKNPISIYTIKAVDVIVSLLTDKEKELLTIVLNGERITVVEQLCSRWWSQVPITNHWLVFRAEAAKIIKANKLWLTLLTRLEQNDFLIQLLDPENYIEKQKKATIGKTSDKRQIDKDTDHANLMRTISRNISGEGGTNRDADYGAEWDRSDRARLDKMVLKRPDRDLISTESGEEDDTIDEEEETDLTSVKSIKDVGKFINKVERLDHVQGQRKGSERAIATFGDGHEEIEEKRIDIFNLGLSQATNSTVGDQYITENTFVEASKRQGFITLREKIILAEAINNLHNIEFPDIHEKFFKLLDPLFKEVMKVCQ